MVIMFLFFGYQKWFPYEFERLVPFISNGPLIWWLYPVFGHIGASYFLGVSEWTFGSLLLGLLGQAARRAGRPGIDRHLHRNRHHHPVYAGRLGRRCRRLPCDDRQRALPDEGRRPARRLALPTEAGRGSPDAAIGWHPADGDASPASVPPRRRLRVRESRTVEDRPFPISSSAPANARDPSPLLPSSAALEPASGGDQFSLHRSFRQACVGDRRLDLQTRLHQVVDLFTQGEAMLHRGGGTGRRAGGGEFH
jgi:hypothetical protein